MSAGGGPAAGQQQQQEKKNRRREDYKYMLEYRTRWSDNDMYHHVNNSIYNFLYDSIINTYLMERCRLVPATSAQYGLAVHSASDFFRPIAFPAVADLALRVVRLGASSVTYEVALFERGHPDVRAVGSFVHVFVDRATGRPVAGGMNPDLRAGLEELLVLESPPTSSKL